MRLRCPRPRPRRAWAGTGPSNSSAPLRGRARGARCSTWETGSRGRRRAEGCAGQGSRGAWMRVGGRDALLSGARRPGIGVGRARCVATRATLESARESVCTILATGRCREAAPRGEKTGGKRNPKSAVSNDTRGCSFARPDSGRPSGTGNVASPSTRKTSEVVEAYLRSPDTNPKTYERENCSRLTYSQFVDLRRKRSKIVEGRRWASSPRPVDSCRIVSRGPRFRRPTDPGDLPTTSAVAFTAVHAPARASRRAMAPRGAAPARVASLASAARVPAALRAGAISFSPTRRGRRARGRQRGAPGPRWRCPPSPATFNVRVHRPRRRARPPLLPAAAWRAFDSPLVPRPFDRPTTPLSAASLPSALRPCARPPRRRRRRTPPPPSSSASPRAPSSASVPCSCPAWAAPPRRSRRPTPACAISSRAPSASSRASPSSSSPAPSSSPATS